LDMNLYVIKGMLSPYGLHIDTATSGYEAIEKIKFNAYDLVFMDHMMPKMNGVEATREIRKWEAEELSKTRLPIIALTANAVSGMKEMFLANGFNGFISKPIIMQELDKVLREWMSPEKITSYKKPETVYTDETYASFIKDIEKTGEINTGIGLIQVMGNKDMYRSTLEIFYQKLFPVCDEMTAFLDTKDLENFAISAHSMKTSLAIIGASVLSKTALELERASENGDIDFCTRLFGEFKGKLLSLHKQLSVIFQNAPEREQSGTTDNLPKNAPKASFTGKVLLVDDTKLVLNVIKEKLSSYGLQVVTAESGPEAIDKIKNDAYDIVFMDHKMPKMNGIEATREIRKIGSEYEKLPVIALTANIDSGMEEFYLANGFSGFLSKPIINEKLEAIFRKWLPPCVHT